MQPAIQSNSSQTTNNQWWGNPWGSPESADFYRRQGWSGRPVRGVTRWGKPVVLFGRPGKRGCFAIGAIPKDGIWVGPIPSNLPKEELVEVWFYTETPETVAAGWKNQKNRFFVDSSLYLTDGWASHYADSIERSGHV